MTFISRVALGAAVLVTTPVAPTADAGPPDILGWWHGTSICVKETWNASCNDEKVVYEIVPLPADSARALLHASKIVAGELVPMGDQELSYVPVSHAWEGDFANSRVSIRWTFQVHGDSLTGVLFVRPEMRIARNVATVRGKVIRF